MGCLGKESRIGDRLTGYWSDSGNLRTMSTSLITVASFSHLDESSKYNKIKQTSTKLIETYCDGLSNVSIRYSAKPLPGDSKFKLRK